MFKKFSHDIVHDIITRFGNGVFFRSKKYTYKHKERSLQAHGKNDNVTIQSKIWGCVFESAANNYTSMVMEIVQRKLKLKVYRNKYDTHPEILVMVRKILS